MLRLLYDSPQKGSSSEDNASNATPEPKKLANFDYSSTEHDSTMNTSMESISETVQNDISGPVVPASGLGSSIGQSASINFKDKLPTEHETHLIVSSSIQTTTKQSDVPVTVTPTSAKLPKEANSTHLLTANIPDVSNPTPVQQAPNTSASYVSINSMINFCKTTSTCTVVTSSIKIIPVCLPKPTSTNQTVVSGLLQNSKAEFSHSKPSNNTCIVQPFIVKTSPTSSAQAKKNNKANADSR